MDENKIRQIVQDEMKRMDASKRFNVNTMPFHTHNGKDSPQIKEENLIQSMSVSGSVTFTQETTYTIYLNGNFTPSNILAYGNVFNAAPPDYSGLTVRALTIGSAFLTPAFYLQPNDSTSVVTSNKQYPFPTEQPDGSIQTVPVQSSVYIATIQGGSPASRALSSEGHIVSVEYPNGTIHARVTVTDFSKNFIKLSVPYLDSGWSITVNYVIS